MGSKRKRTYREYLQSDHWKTLRQEALQRDGGECVQCGGRDNLQVNHLRYKNPWEACVLDDVETLCRQCHREYHGIGPTAFELQSRRIEQLIAIEAPRAVLVGEWKKLKRLIELENPFDLDDFAGLIFHHVYQSWALEAEAGNTNWWRGPRGDFWRDRALRIKNSLRRRADNVRKALRINV